jgi:hypothetical protein
VTGPCHLAAWIHRQHGASFRCHAQCAEGRPHALWQPRRCDEAGSCHICRREACHGPACDVVLCCRVRVMTIQPQHVLRAIMGPRTGCRGPLCTPAPTKQAAVTY